MASSSSSVFRSLSVLPADAILGMGEAFRQCTDPRKINLTVGAYRDERGLPVVLPSVLHAEEIVYKKLINHEINKEYLPIRGYQPFYSAAAELIFTPELVQSKHVASVQSLSGTGALRIGAELLRDCLEADQLPAIVHISNPTWSNHQAIFQSSGFQVKTYRYLNDAGELDYPGIVEYLNSLPDRSLVLFHACAHNPTGMDPSVDQWKELASICLRKNHRVFFDVAYQGFATGDPDQDVFCVREFARLGVTVLVAQSFAKNMGMYGERLGALHVTAQSTDEHAAIYSHLEVIIRRNYSSPPLHGPLVAAEILRTPNLRKIWLDELKTLSGRISAMRKLLRSQLEELKTPGNWSILTNQIGMFCMTGLSQAQSERMISVHAVYMLKNGRISVSGLTEQNCQYVAKAFHEVLTTTPRN